MAFQKLFQASEITRVTGIPTTRLNKFVESPGYGIKPSIRGTAGRGAPRLYSLDDLLGIALAWWLFQAGLRSKVIGRVLKSKPLLKTLKESEDWTSETAQDRFLLIRRELKSSDKPAQDVRAETFEEIVNELKASREHSIHVFPMGELLTNLWKELGK